MVVPGDLRAKKSNSNDRGSIGEKQGLNAKKE